MPASTFIKVQCPNCHATGKASPEKLSSPVKCPKCGAVDRFQPIQNQPTGRKLPTSLDDAGVANAAVSSRSVLMSNYLLASAILASVLVAISVFLPWIHMGALQSSHIETWQGKVMVVTSLALSAALAYGWMSQRYLRAIVACGILLSAWMTYHSGELLVRWSGVIRPSTGNAISDAFARGMLSKVSPGIGVYVALIASALIVAVLSIWLFLTEKKVVK